MRIVAMKWLIIILVIVVLALWFFPDAFKDAISGAAGAVKSGVAGLF